MHKEVVLKTLELQRLMAEELEDYENIKVARTEVCACTPRAHARVRANPRARTCTPLQMSAALKNFMKNVSEVFEQVRSTRP